MESEIPTWKKRIQPEVKEYVAFMETIGVAGVGRLMSGRHEIFILQIGHGSGWNYGTG